MAENLGRIKEYRNSIKMIIGALKAKKVVTTWKKFEKQCSVI